MGHRPERPRSQGLHAVDGLELGDPRLQAGGDEPQIEQGVTRARVIPGRAPLDIPAAHLDIPPPI
ncbi:hypothetical protein BE08_02775 [Sorangium cellulosum]|uniref:Uncharacterized protein n=1 Tax=Sorangium cellulosum TaxID=56 RepID=A0A150PEL8_SORCE|nr:hypothetical protein BE08_02775 [Sorangium cellulosum]